MASLQERGWAAATAGLCCACYTVLTCPLLTPWWFLWQHLHTHKVWHIVFKLAGTPQLHPAGQAGRVKSVGGGCGSECTERRSRFACEGWVIGSSCSSVSVNLTATFTTGVYMNCCLTAVQTSTRMPACHSSGGGVCRRRCSEHHQGFAGSSSRGPLCRRTIKLAPLVTQASCSSLTYNVQASRGTAVPPCGLVGAVLEPPAVIMS